MVRESDCCEARACLGSLLSWVYWLWGPPGPQWWREGILLLIVLIIIANRY